VSGADWLGLAVLLPAAIVLLVWRLVTWEEARRWRPHPRQAIFDLEHELFDGMKVGWYGHDGCFRCHPILKPDDMPLGPDTARYEKR
jgi:hypothetical protein